MMYFSFDCLNCSKNHKITKLEGIDQNSQKRRSREGLPQLDKNHLQKADS